MGEIPQQAPSDGRIQTRPAPGHSRSLGCRRGVNFAEGSCESSVYRMMAFSIALLLATGPNGSILCRTWCDPATTATSQCHQDAASGSTSVSGNDCCHDVALDATTFVQEDVYRGVRSAHATDAILPPQLQVNRFKTDTFARPITASAWVRAKRPLVPILRI